MSRVLAVALAGLTLASAAGCGGASQAGAPVWALAPTGPRGGGESSGAVAHVCLSPGDGLAPSGGAGEPWVDSDPTGAVVLWVPGLNSKRCRTVLTHLDASHAVRFAAAVDAAKPFPPGTYACPNDDGSFATVFLAYPRHTHTEVVRLQLAGCGGLTAPGRGRLETAGLADLGPIPHGIEMRSKG